MIDFERLERDADRLADEFRDARPSSYNRLTFPAGGLRRSIATYAYSPGGEGAKGRSTTWFPEESNAAKRMLGKSWPKLVEIKGKLFGSATSRNQ